MLQLILVRHGETDSNKRGTYLGWTDVELNEDGIKQAYKAKEKLSNIKIDAIYSSPLKRAKRTAEIINESHNTGIIFSDKLKERNFGKWDDLTYDEILKKYRDEYDLWIKDANYCIEKGESFNQAYDRLKEFIDDFVGSNKDGTFLVVTHLGCIRKILAHLLGMKREDSWRFRVDNASLTRVEINDEKYAYLSLLNG